MFETDNDQQALGQTQSHCVFFLQYCNLNVLIQNASISKNDYQSLRLFLLQKSTILQNLISRTEGNESQVIPLQLLIMQLQVDAQKNIIMHLVQ